MRLSAKEIRLRGVQVSISLKRSRLYTDSLSYIDHSHITIMAARLAIGSVSAAHLATNMFHDTDIAPPGLPLLLSPTPQPSSLLPFRRPSDPTTIQRDQSGHRQGSCIRACCTLHEGHPGDATVRLLAGEHSDPGFAGRQSAEIHRFQRTRGRGA